MSAATSSPARPAARRGVSREERASLVGMGAFILLLHVVGWGLLMFVVVPNRYALGSGQVFGVALGVTAYTLGMRHAFDADHIAAIDNTTRKLMSDGRRPVSTGFWFSLGHSSVVLALCLLLAIGVRALAGQVGSDSSRLQETTAVVGTTISGLFLLAIGLVNLVVLRHIWRVWREMRRGAYDEQTLDGHLDRRGVVSRLLRPVTRAVRRPWHMYPTGLLFGLGFDTATEVSLLVLAGGAAAFRLPWYAILCLPVLFAAGMSLLDTLDGAFMNFAYGWAFAKPVRKVYYNLTVTALSVAVALVVGGIEIVGLLSDRLHVTTGPVAWLGGVDLNSVGFIIVGLFVVTWVLAVAAYRVGGVERKWEVAIRRPDGVHQP